MANMSAQANTDVEAISIVHADKFPKPSHRHIGQRAVEEFGRQIKVFAFKAFQKLNMANYFKKQDSKANALVESTGGKIHQSHSNQDLCITPSQACSNDKLPKVSSYEVKDSENALRTNREPVTKRKDSLIKDSRDNIIDGVYWGSVLHIDEVNVIQLVRSLLDPEGTLPASELAVEDIGQGSYNRAFTIKVGMNKVVLRVPRFGVKGIWNKHDAVELRSQALTMRWIRKRTGIPIPEILSYDITHENSIKHPFLLMSHVAGRRVCDVWGDVDNLELEQTRRKILASIAKAVSRLQHLSFKKSDMLHFDDDDEATEPTVGNAYQLLEDGLTNCNQVVLHKTRMAGPRSSSYRDFRWKLHHWWSSQIHECKPISEDAVSLHLLKGEKEILHTMVDYLPSAPAIRGDTPETFVLTPPDFNWQNIMVDDDGEVTGFLDWDSTVTVARFQGWAALPLWLCADFHIWNAQSESSAAQYAQYRAYYSEAISRAMGGKGDCAFTQKSVLFEALNNALKFPQDTLPILEKIMKLVLPDSTIVDYLVSIGKNGLEEHERERLVARFSNLFDCVPGADPRFLV